MFGPVIGCCLLAIACGKSRVSGQQTPSATESLPISCQAAVGVGPVLSIDDFEDGDLKLNQAGNLHGVWYVNNDGTGEQTPAPGDESDADFIAGAGSPESPEHALHTSGVGFERWGAFAAARLNASRSRACRYDLSAYSGVHFEAKGEGSLRVNLGTVATTPVVDGGECNGDACSDFGSSIQVDTEWRSIDVPFEALAQPSWADAAAFDPARALRISLWAERGDFEFWVDDLRFYQ